MVTRIPLASQLVEIPIFLTGPGSGKTPNKLQSQLVEMPTIIHHLTPPPQKAIAACLPAPLICCAAMPQPPLQNAMLTTKLLESDDEQSLGASTRKDLAG
jgi:hypothetical protein